MNNITVHHTPQSAPHHGILQLGELHIPCALGKNGLISAQDKREGDGGTPIGSWPLRRCFVRADKLPAPLPHIALETHIITRDMGWCDDASHPLYNECVTLPFAASHETLWRDQDDCYDIIIELGYNDDPIIAGHGSAIFFHCSKMDADGSLHHTEGCIAIPKETILTLLPQLQQGMMITINPQNGA